MEISNLKLMKTLTGSDTDYLKKRLYEKFNSKNNNKWSNIDYEDINNFCNNLNLNDDIFSEANSYIDRDFIIEELSEAILKRKNYKSVGHDKIY